MTSAVLLGLISTLLFGLRHGIDYDHIAAITDITSARPDRKESMKLGLLYATGHGVVVLLLGILAVTFGQFLPSWIDTWMERFVGVTLIVLGVFVFWTLIHTPKEEFKLTSRFRLLQQLALRAKVKMFGGPDRPPLTTYGNRSAFIVGVIHGVGAETPTQLGLFLFAAGVGGKLVGMLGVVLFVVGVMITNTIMSAVAARVFHSNTRKSAIYRGLAGITAAYSLVVGGIFLAGAADILPPL